MASTVTLVAFVTERESIRIHSAGCSHTLRETRAHGTGVMVAVESQLGLVRELKRKGIRSRDLYFLGCVGVPEAFAILSPNGEAVSMASSRKSASEASSRIRCAARRELAEAIGNLSVFARQMMDAQQ